MALSLERTSRGVFGMIGWHGNVPLANLAQKLTPLKGLDNSLGEAPPLVC